MKNIKERVLEISDYIIDTNQTIREISKHYSVSKSTVHKDLSERLKYIDYSKYVKVKEILVEHDKNKHIRGGISTKHKYESLLKF